MQSSSGQLYKIHSLTDGSHAALFNNILSIIPRMFVEHHPVAVHAVGLAVERCRVKPGRWIKRYSFGITMEYNEEIFCTQYPIITQFLRHSVYRTELYDLYNRYKVKSEFWTSTIDAHYLQAVIYWCMVFGADGCNPTHWKKLSDTASEELMESFRNGLYNNTCLDEKGFREFWQGINDFRGGFAAHRETEFKGKSPMLKTAQEIAFFYDDWIRQVIFPASLGAEPLRERAESLKIQVRKIANHYMTEWKQFNFETEPQL